MTQPSPVVWAAVCLLAVLCTSQVQLVSGSARKLLAEGLTTITDATAANSGSQGGGTAVSTTVDTAQMAAAVDTASGVSGSSQTVQVSNAAIPFDGMTSAATLRIGAVVDNAYAAVTAAMAAAGAPAVSNVMPANITSDPQGSYQDIRSNRNDDNDNPGSKGRDGHGHGAGRNDDNDGSRGSMGSMQTTYADAPDQAAAMATAQKIAELQKQKAELTVLQKQKREKNVARAKSMIAAIKKEMESRAGKGAAHTVAQALAPSDMTLAGSAVLPLADASVAGDPVAMAAAVQKLMFATTSNMANDIMGTAP